MGRADLSPLLLDFTRSAFCYETWSNFLVSKLFKVGSVCGDASDPGVFPTFPSLSSSSCSISAFICLVSAAGPTQDPRWWYITVISPLFFSCICRYWKLIFFQMWLESFKEFKQMLSICCFLTNVIVMYFL